MFDITTVIRKWIIRSLTWEYLVVLISILTDMYIYIYIYQRNDVNKSLVIRVNFHHLELPNVAFLGWIHFGSSFALVSLGEVWRI